MDLGLSTDAQSSATAVSFTENAQSLCSHSDQVGTHLRNIVSEVNAGTDSCMAAHHDIAESDNVVGIVSKDDHVNEVSMDVQDLSSAVDPLLETTLEYSVCSDVHDGQVADTCEMQPIVKYCDESTTEPVINVQKNPVADIRTHIPVSNDLQKPVDLLAISNNVNVDLRNNPTVCSPPPTLMVV